MSTLKADNERLQRKMEQSTNGPSSGSSIGVRQTKTQSSDSKFGLVSSSRTGTTANTVGFYSFVLYH